MCNLYSLNKKRDMVARFFRVSHNRTAAFKPAGAIFPRHIAPVVRCAEDGEREMKLTRFRGHQRICVEGVHDAKQAEEARSIPA
jgi:putative SOS response-associated peptidase YedK